MQEKTFPIFACMYFHYIAVSDMNNSENAQKSVVPLDFQLYHFISQLSLTDYRYFSYFLSLLIFYSIMLSFPSISKANVLAVARTFAFYPLKNL